MRVLQLSVLAAFALATAHGFFLNHDSESGDEMTIFNHQFFENDHNGNTVEMSYHRNGGSETQKVTRNGATTQRTRNSPDENWEYTTEAAPDTRPRCIFNKPASKALPEPPKRLCGCKHRRPHVPIENRIHQALAHEKTSKHVERQLIRTDEGEEKIDYDELARATVEDVPARLRGVREEWDNRVGWGRREKLTPEDTQEPHDESSEADEAAQDEDNTTMDADDEADEDDGQEPAPKRFKEAPPAWGTGRSGTGRRFEKGDFVDVKVLHRGQWEGDHVTSVVDRVHKNGRYDLIQLDGTPITPALKSGIRGRHLRHLSFSQVAAAEAKQVEARLALEAKVSREAAAVARQESAAAVAKAKAMARAEMEAQAAAAKQAAEERVRAAQQAAEVRRAEEAQQAADKVLAERLTEMEAMQEKYKIAQGHAESAAKALKRMKLNPRRV